MSIAIVFFFNILVKLFANKIIKKSCVTLCQKYFFYLVYFLLFFLTISDLGYIYIEFHRFFSRINNESKQRCTIVCLIFKPEKH